MAAKLLPPMQFIPALTPKYTEPRHLAPLVALFERIAAGESVHAAVSVPPGHEKTETLSHCTVWLQKKRPAIRACYATYGQRLSVKKSRRIRQLAEKAGVPLDKNSAATADWRTGVEEGGMWATSVGGAVVGERLDLLLLDDLVKDRVTAESVLARERTYEWAAELATREEPGASAILIMHRWHREDVAGRLIDDGWEHINLPALNDRGEALCPERFSTAKLEKIRERIGDYAFDGLYMGRPPARGDRVFKDVHTFDALPEKFDEIAIGADFAYSVRTHADYSCAVVLGRAGDRYFVLEVLRLQVTAPTFRAELEKLRHAYKGSSIVAYVSGTEKGAVDMMAAQGLSITTRPAVADKFTRAQPVAAAWNAGKVLLPASSKAAWREKFVSELAGFTGIRDRHDDQVDALAAAFDAVNVVTREDDDYCSSLIAGSRDREDPGFVTYDRYGFR